MKSLQSIFQIQKKKVSTDIDDKTIFHLFSQIVYEEYGRKGSQNIIPSFYKNKTLFVKFTQSLWAQEVWMNRGHLIKRLNDRIGKVVVHKINTNS